jgi:hypothetical protein
MSSLRTHHTSTNPSSNIISPWRRLHINTHAPPPPQHIRCGPAFHNTFGDLPFWIDLATSIRLVTQHVQGITPLSDDDKLQSGISNMVSLQAGITCLAETNVEWRNYSCRQGYKAAFTKLYSALRHIFSSSSEISSTSHKRGGTVTSATDRWTHRVHLSAKIQLVLEDGPTLLFPEKITT